MMVIEFTNNSAAVVLLTRTGESRVFPADRCSWVTIDEAGSRGYAIENVVFYPGNTSEDGFVIPTAQAQVRLGFIGKSGRFVAISTAL